MCASCHQRRTLIESAFIADTVCAPVPHRHIILTVPRQLRPLFFRNRSLLSELHLAASAHEFPRGRHAAPIGNSSVCGKI
ncbi:MAG: hypothetical protein EBY24_21570 [Betaproteobacteria bacterium]|nr:hypothetical protein [Betaproteobacteria bacterium]